MNHTELAYETNSEVKIVSNDINEIKNELMQSDTYNRLEHYDSKIALFNVRKMSKQIKEKDYEKMLKSKIDEGNRHPEDLDVTVQEDLPNLRARRYMECITVKDGEKLWLLCDDPRSLMRTLHNTQLILLRVFDCDITL